MMAIPLRGTGGSRVKSVLTTNAGVTTTYFVSTHYEVTNGLVTKYYYAGSQRIAIRENNVLSYIIGDHLGSNSIVTDSSGNVISNTKYKAWGEVRYSSGSNPSEYTYTGQYSYASDFGLHFYNARWYDSSLSRFAQADTIVPGGVQGLDRYAAMNNNPVRYTDPSGHLSCSNANAAEGNCENRQFWTAVEEDYGIKFKGQWDARYKRAVYDAVRLVASAFTSVMGGDLASNFASVYQTRETALTFTWGSCDKCNGAGGYTYSSHDIRFASMAAISRPDYFLRSVNNVIHELGHAFNSVMGGVPVQSLTNDMASNPLLERIADSNSYSGFASRNDQRTWVQNSSTAAGEVFADQFLGWTRNTWETNEYGKWVEKAFARSDWMTTNMTEWLTP